jgi:hypothetical protein
MLWFVLLAAGSPLAAQTSTGEGPESQPECFIVAKTQGKVPENFRFRLGQPLQVKVSGSLLDKVRTEWRQTKPIALYFDGEHISDLKSPPQLDETGKAVVLNFTLIRDAQNDANRRAWDSLFRKQGKYQMTLQPALGIGSELPMPVHSDLPFQFYVASSGAIWLILLAGVTILLIAYWYLVKKTRMLRDTGTNYYSLGKSQMAFWGLLVVLSFVGVWILTGTMERIPPQALILLGISGATGLSSVVIGNSKRTELQAKLDDKLAKLAELQQEQQKLQAQQAAAPSQAATDRLAAIAAEMDTREKEMTALSKQLEPGESAGFWRDICDDGSGASFHRLQVVIWTLVLGTVFVHTVARMMSMPEFPDTLLTLMGISNATYLGFKIPEKP